ncbi:DUF1616 domain-containing protein [Methanococcoides orientis]|uniref:DUF1616 domain-containing protein n=1 Tax=Methanococcoides orientis TaxID=2822137 RepID=UPI001E512E39|nr:DUF1616 domain-containing protein [Methanococcoides orientis]UGV40068.1 DUF1616 domain-containing protein [Methanococcoides orientis]
MKYRNNIPSDIQVVIALVLLTCIFIMVPTLSNTPIRTALGLPIVLFLPGYALIAALFPAKDDLDGIERFALSFGLSIAVVPLIGLALNYTTWGIRLYPILISLSAFTIIMCIVAMFRRNSLPEEDQFNVPFSSAYISLKDEISKKPENKLDQILTILLVLSIVASILTLAYVVVTPKEGEKFTEFYILGPDGMADGYPTDLQLGQNGTVIIGIVNHEYADTEYSIKLMLDNKSQQIDQELFHITIPHNETWEKEVTFTPPSVGKDMKLQFLLYKDKNMAESYRDLHLWIDVSEV